MKVKGHHKVVECVLRPKENQRSQSLPRVLARCAKISAASADMRTGFRSHGVRSALQSESSSPRQPRFARRASLIENQSPRALTLELFTRVFAFSEDCSPRFLQASLTPLAAAMRTGFCTHRYALRAERGARASSSSRQPRWSVAHPRELAKAV